MESGGGGREWERGGEESEIHVGIKSKGDPINALSRSTSAAAAGFSPLPPSLSLSLSLLSHFKGATERARGGDGVSERTRERDG